MQKTTRHAVRCADDELNWNPRAVRLSSVLAGILSLALFYSPAHAFGALAAPSYSVTLAWDPSPGPGVAGYRIYYGATSGNYTNSVTVGNVTTSTIPDLVSGAMYFITTKAYNAAGVESLFSNEIFYIVPGGEATLQITMAVDKQAALVVTGKSGHTYEIETSANLTSWSVVGTVTLGAGGTASFTDASAPGYAKRFYRAHDTTP